MRARARASVRVRVRVRLRVRVTAAPSSSRTEEMSRVARRPRRSSRLPEKRSAPRPATKLRPDVAASCSSVLRRSELAMSRRLPEMTPTS